MILKHYQSFHWVRILISEAVLWTPWIHQGRTASAAPGWDGGFRMEDGGENFMVWTFTNWNSRILRESQHTPIPIPKAQNDWGSPKHKLLGQGVWGMFQGYVGKFLDNYIVLSLVFLEHNFCFWIPPWYLYQFETTTFMQSLPFCEDFLWFNVDLITGVSFKTPGCWGVIAERLHTHWLIDLQQQWSIYYDLVDKLLYYYILLLSITLLSV